MPTISLRNLFSSDVTVISNAFIDHFMVTANGEYVKIYLCILRWSMEAAHDWTLCTIADKLECTTKDVVRALNYWAKEGLLECEYNEEGHLTSLTFLDPAAVYKTADNSAPETSKNEDKNEERKTVLSASRIKSLIRSSEVKQLIFVAEQYIGHPLSPTESETILYFYDKMHFSVDLLEYLIEYCVSKNASGISYIKKVGFAWADEGITSVDEAKTAVFDHSHECYSIMDAYGLKGRSPAASERKYMKTWLGCYGFSLNVILMAIDRTMGRLHSPRFEYTDSILKNWRDSGVKTPDDVKRLDDEHVKNDPANEKAPSKPTVSSKSKTTPKGRSYDYSSLEQELLKAN